MPTPSQVLTTKVSYSQCQSISDDNKYLLALQEKAPNPTKTREFTQGIISQSKKIADSDCISTPIEERNTKKSGSRITFSNPNVHYLDKIIQDIYGTGSPEHIKLRNDPTISMQIIVNALDSIKQLLLLDEDAPALKLYVKCGKLVKTSERNSIKSIIHKLLFHKENLQHSSIPENKDILPKDIVYSVGNAKSDRDDNSGSSDMLVTINIEDKNLIINIKRLGDLFTQTLGKRHTDILNTITNTESILKMFLLAATIINKKGKIKKEINPKNIYMAFEVVVEYLKAKALKNPQIVQASTSTATTKTKALKKPQIVQESITNNQSTSTATTQTKAPNNPQLVQASTSTATTQTKAPNNPQLVQASTSTATTKTKAPKKPQLVQASTSTATTKTKASKKPQIVQASTSTATIKPKAPKKPQRVQASTSTATIKPKAPKKPQRVQATTITATIKTKAETSIPIPISIKNLEKNIMFFLDECKSEKLRLFIKDLMKDFKKNKILFNEFCQISGITHNIAQNVNQTLKLEIKNKVKEAIILFTPNTSNSKISIFDEEYKYKSSKNGCYINSHKSVLTDKTRAALNQLIVNFLPQEKHNKLFKLIKTNTFKKQISIFYNELLSSKKIESITNLNEYLQNNQQYYDKFQSDVATVFYKVIQSEIQQRQEEDEFLTLNALLQDNPLIQQDKLLLLVLGIHNVQNHILELLSKELIPNGATDSIDDLYNAYTNATPSTKISIDQQIYHILIDHKKLYFNEIY